MNKLLPLVTAITLLFFQITNFAQAPNLGTAANFVLFTTTGAVTNTGMSHLTGNVGTNNGSMTGFGNVNGVMHNSNLTTAACANDLLSAYNQLNATTPTSFHAPLLGNGESFNAGVYSISGSASLNQDLTLNAQGNANAVFIIQIQGAFSTTASSRVILLNGAKACNVFWKVEGLVSMASNTAMKGTIIVNNAAITIGTGVSLEGRALSTTGAVSITNTSANTPVGCGSPVLTGPAAPNLGSTACYAIFSGNGSVTNAGVTTVTGDVGTNVGLTVGFTPLTVTGTIHTIPDGSTAACAADLLSVYNYLNPLPADIELLYPAQFGNSLVLTPHTYVLNAATTLTDTLFLDAQSNANAVFVIKVNGAFSTSTFATVVLVNGTEAKNVFWKVEGAVSLNNSSKFKGTIVCNSGAVSLNTGVQLDGRAFTTGGALSTAAVTVTMPSGCSALPVSWLYFRGTSVQTGVLLEWATTMEINNGFFTVEKSSDGVTFETLGVVNAAATNDRSGYSYTDHQPNSVTYYRISQTDKDGQKKYFRTIQVKMAGTGIKVLQYASESYVSVQVSGVNAAAGTITLYTVDGRKISTQKIMLTKEVSTYKIEKPQHKGMYILYIQSHGEKVYNGKVMVL